jgi:hypothetical protein
MLMATLPFISYLSPFQNFSEVLKLKLNGKTMWTLKELQTQMGK